MRRTKAIQAAAIEKKLVCGHDHDHTRKEGRCEARVRVVGLSSGMDLGEGAPNQCTDCIAFLIHCTIIITEHEPYHYIFELKLAACHPA